MKLEKTQEFAKIFSSITHELKSKIYNFNVDVDTFQTAFLDFLTELDTNILTNNIDLIVSRLDKNFVEYYPYFDLNDFDDTPAKLLSKYREFSEYLFDDDGLLTYQGLCNYKETVKKEQAKNAVKTQPATKSDIETIDTLVQKAINFELIPAPQKISDKDYNVQIEILKSRHDLGFNVWLQENQKEHEGNYTFENFKQYLKSYY